MRLVDGKLTYKVRGKKKLAEHDVSQIRYHRIDGGELSWLSFKR